MNKNRIITGIGVVLLTTGIIGGTWSGINALPTVMNNVQESSKKYNENEVIYKSELKLTKLNVDLDTSGIIIKKYNGKDIEVERSGNKELSNITVSENNNELTISEVLKDNNNIPTNIDDIVRYAVNNIFKAHYSNITVYVPENIDLDIKTNNGTLFVSEDISLNNVNFDTNYGGISLEDTNKKIKNLNIKSDEHIYLQIREVYSTENLNIEAGFVEINENNYTGDIQKMPENVKITTHNDYHEESSVYINTKSPIAKNLIIDSKATVGMNLPLLDYKFNFDIKTSRGIDFSDDNYERYMGTSLEKYFKYDDNDDGYDNDYDNDREEYSQKELVGPINEELKDNPNVYNVNIKSAIVRFN